MDVLTEKRKLDSKISDIVNNLKFKNHKMNLAGSASLKSQRYYSDYDFNTQIKEYKPVTIYNEFIKILSHHHHDMYFIELKIEYTDGSKIKIYDTSKIKKAMFKNINYIKLDYVLWSDYHFKELSVMYIFRNTVYSIDDIKDDYNQLLKDGNNYKAVKRLFTLSKWTNDKKESVKLTRFFNSKYGQIYEINNNLKAIKLMKEHYDNDDVNKKIEVNLKYRHITTDIDPMIKANDEILNKASKKYLI